MPKFEVRVTQRDADWREPQGVTSLSCAPVGEPQGVTSLSCAPVGEPQAVRSLLSVIDLEAAPLEAEAPAARG